MDYKYLTEKQLKKLDKLFKEYKSKYEMDIARLNDVSESKVLAMFTDAGFETATLSYQKHAFNSQTDGSRVSSKLVIKDIPHKSWYKKVRVVGIVVNKGKKEYFVCLFIKAKNPETKKYEKPRDAISLGYLGSNGFNVLPYHFYVMDKTSYRRKVVEIIADG